MTTNLTFTPKTKAYKLDLNAPAIVLQKLHAVQAKNLAINGTLAISANGQGTLDNPQLTASVQLPQLSMKDKTTLSRCLANNSADPDDKDVSLAFRNLAMMNNAPTARIRTSWHD